MPRFYSRKLKKERLLENGFKSLFLRIPKINTLHNKFIKKKLEERRGKYSKTKAEQTREKDVREGRRLSNSCDYMRDCCYKCDSPSDQYFTITSDYDTVCKFCAVVQPEKYFEEQMDYIQKISSSYQKRTYISERLRLFGNVEPRICREDLKLIGQVYSEIDEIYCKVYNEEEDKERRTQRLRDLGIDLWFPGHVAEFEKNSIKVILQCVDYIREKNPTLRYYDGVEKEDGRSFVHKYTERWLQIKIFLCGVIYYEQSVCSIPDTNLLNDMYKLCTIFLDIYENHRIEARVYSDKRSIVSTDLLFLVILYNIDPSLVETYGWYFLNDSLRSLLSPTSENAVQSAIQKDYFVIEKIIEYLNSQEAKYKNTREIKNILFRDSWYTPPKLLDLIELACLSK